MEGNEIGTNAGGTAAVANSECGIYVGSSSATIGGTASGAGNVISGNASYGIDVNGAGATNNLIEGDDIGTDPTGTVALANQYGVFIEGGATANTIGGATASARDIISGNSVDGVHVQGPTTSGNVIAGDWIGLAADGATALPNRSYGVRINGGATGTRVGTSSGDPNAARPQCHQRQPRGRRDHRYGWRGQHGGRQLYRYERGGHRGRRQCGGWRFRRRDEQRDRRRHGGRRRAM